MFQHGLAKQPLVRQIGPVQQRLPLRVLCIIDPISVCHDGSSKQVGRLLRLILPVIGLSPPYVGYSARQLRGILVLLWSFMLDVLRKQTML